MKYVKLISIVFILSLIPGCGTTSTSNTNSGVTSANSNSSDEASAPVAVERPDSIKEKMKARGDQDEAQPDLTLESPKEGETIESSTVKIKVKIGGDLKGLKMGKDDSGAGNHVHVILDNQPYAAHYMWDEGFELRNVADGEHTLRVFSSRPWHESYKNPEAFKIIKFTVKNGRSDETKPTVDSNNNKMADAKSGDGKIEGADVKESTAGDVDFKKPLLTYSRPKGEYKGADAEAIMLDFWLSNAKLAGDGGEYSVRFTINGGEPRLIEKWAPIWLKGWKDGKNTVKLELVDKSGNLVKNGGYNSTEREITVSK
ncbi:MAG: hypothetical protein KDB79_00500 [Acidobacteria bacterium]|nr:hypothetical protein [Acidobacteriota bacterium]